MKMKKIILGMVAVLTLVTLTACGKKRLAVPIAGRRLKRTKSNDRFR